MKKSKKPDPHPRSSIRDALVRRVTNASPLLNQRAVAAYRLRAQCSADDLFAVFPRIFAKPGELERLHGHPFPRELQQLYAQKAIGAPAGALNEVVWALSCAVARGAELHRFNTLRESYEMHFLAGDRESADATLNLAQEELGASIWLVQAQLAAAQHWDGIEETRRLTKLYSSSASGNALVQTLVEYIGKRVEATGIKDYLKTELTQFTERLGDDDLARYLETKLFELQDVKTSSVAPTLFFDAQSCAIDYYETLIAILQSAASDQTIPSHMARLLEKPLKVLYRRVKDHRLRGIMLGLGIIPEEHEPVNPDRAKLIELYTAANYQAAIPLIGNWLEKNPTDLAIHVLQVRACLHGEVEPPATIGILSEIKRALASVISADENFYAEALNLLTITDRHYGQAWASYLRATVAYELREQEAKFPPIWLRDVYVRDPHLTPFSAIAATDSAKDYISERSDIARFFPRTRAIFEAVSKGKVDTELATDPRLSRYLGIHELAQGDPAIALSHFERLLISGLGSDRMRSAGSAALACVKMGRMERAVDIVVSAFLANSNVPSLLPIPAVVRSLNDPRTWPTSISLPLLFDLYANYFSRDQLAQLRYAFELFQERNSILEPEDLAQRADELGKDRVIAYLARVWRPEVMRQTVLYAGTREIEDARIRVCTVLASLDPQHADDYLAEIRRRVKQQEITKATTLVEQSKVYVDIQAIKSALRKRLGDSYSRYKKAYQSKDDPLLYKLTELLSSVQTQEAPLRQLLSGLHVLSESPQSEADVQFSAIYAEVTHEFLRGEHGLNAYLSTRVRHGTLANTLRKPVADERLVTLRKEQGPGYVENTLWRAEPIGGTDAWSKIAARLEQFATRFDAVIDHLREKLLQIRVVQDLVDSGETNKEALFIYQSSNLERRFLQVSDQSVSDIDELVDICVESLWEKTDVNLKSVRETLESRTRSELMATFDALIESLKPFDGADGINEVRNAIARARTGTSVQLSLVSSWFRRSEVYDRADYAIEFPIQVAQNMIARTMSTAKGWVGPDIRSEAPESAKMPGRTLDAMVDIYYVILENALRHSGVSPENLSIRIWASLKEGVYSARIENDWDCAKQNPEAMQRIEEVQKSLRMAQSSQRAQLERGSGFHKVWVALNGPSYLEPRLELCGSVNGQFAVEFGCRIAGATNEVLDD